MEFDINGAIGQRRYQEQQPRMTISRDMDRSEAVQIDPRYQTEHHMCVKPELPLKQELSTAPSQIRLLKEEIEELESSLENEQSKTEELRRNLDHSFQEKERLRTEGQQNLDEVRLELAKAEKNVQTAIQELQEKGDVLAELEKQLLESKEQCRQLRLELGEKEKDLELAKEDHLEQQEQWTYQLKEAERQRQHAAAQLVVVQGELSAQLQMQVEGMSVSIPVPRSRNRRLTRVLEDSSAEELRQELESRREELENQSKQLKEYQASIEELQNQHRDLQIGLQRSQSHVVELSNQRAKLESETRELETHLNKREAVHQKLLAEQKSTWERALHEERARSRRTEDIVAHEAKLRDKDNTIEWLSDQIEDLRNESSLARSLSDQLSEMHKDTAELRGEKKALEQAKRALAQEKQSLNQQVSRLEQEKRSLNQRISDLEKVRSFEGVVMSVDLSASLDSSKVKLAKDAFRTIINGIRSRNPKTHVGVVVHAKSVSDVRNIAVVDSSTENALDFVIGGGSENYPSAMRNVQSMLSAFHSRYPKAPRRVILIGDGYTIGGYPEYIVSGFRDEGVPIHNVVVRSGYSSSHQSSETSAMSSKTNGQDFTYSGSSSGLSSAALLGRSR
jgi:hypothetical protein